MAYLIIQRKQEKQALFLPSISEKHLIPYQKLLLSDVFKTFQFGADFQK